ncbi:hypothetical protein CYMTET_37832, partial [Cymbomonas tetramitiformis]
FWRSGARRLMWHPLDRCGGWRLVWQEAALISTAVAKRVEAQAGADAADPSKPPSWGRDTAELVFLGTGAAMLSLRRSRLLPARASTLEGLHSRDVARKPAELG